MCLCSNVYSYHLNPPHLTHSFYSLLALFTFKYRVSHYDNGGDDDCDFLPQCQEEDVGHHAHSIRKDPAIL